MARNSNLINLLHCHQGIMTEADNLEQLRQKSQEQLLISQKVLERRIARMNKGKKKE